MLGDLAIDHVALALTNRCHVGRDRAGHRAELRRVAREIGNSGTPNFVLAGHARDVGAGTSDPTALDDDGAPSRSRHIPSQQFAALAAAQDHDLEVFRLRHALLLVRVMAF